MGSKTRIEHFAKGVLGRYLGHSEVHEDGTVDHFTSDPDSLSPFETYTGSSKIKRQAEPNPEAQGSAGGGGSGGDIILLLFLAPIVIAMLPSLILVYPLTRISRVLFPESKGAVTVAATIGFLAYLVCAWAFVYTNTRPIREENARNAALRQMAQSRRKVESTAHSLASRASASRTGGTVALGSPTIQSIEVDLEQVPQIVIHGSGFGSAEPYIGNSDRIRISDVTRVWNAGSTRDPGGDRITLDISSWTDTQVEIKSFQGSYGSGYYSLAPGDELNIAIWSLEGAGPAEYRLKVPDSPLAAPVAANAIPAATEEGPTIESAEFVGSQIVITGKGFGSQPPFTGDSEFIRVSDLTRNWNAGSTRDPGGDRITLEINSWTDTRIKIAGFSGLFGTGGYTLETGDVVQIQVWNPLSGTGPGTIGFRFEPRS